MQVGGDFWAEFSGFYITLDKALPKPKGRTRTIGQIVDLRVGAGPTRARSCPVEGLSQVLGCPRSVAAYVVVAARVCAAEVGYEYSGSDYSGYQYPAKLSHPRGRIAMVRSGALGLTECLQRPCRWL